MAKAPAWISSGSGSAPRVAWAIALEGPLVSLHLARESGEVVATDQIGGLYRIDAEGKLAGVTHGKPMKALAWSDTGERGAALVGHDRLAFYSRQLTQELTIDLPYETTAVACDSHGEYIAVGLLSCRTFLYDRRGKQIRSFETLQPMSRLQFLVTEPALVGTGELGLLASVSFTGKARWQEKLFGTVGDLAISGDDRSILLASYAMGVQCHDHEGSQLGSYQVGGTVAHVATSFSGKQIAAATIERHFYWMDSDGKVHWQVELPEDVARLQCEPLGRGLVIGFKSGRILRLEWS